MATFPSNTYILILMRTVTDTPPPLPERIETLGERLGDLRTALGNVIFGQEQAIDLALIAILAGGHALLIGVPGLAKTLLVESLGRALSLSHKRIQFTPDLMPADIIGSEVLEEGEDGRRHFRFIKGPVFCQLLMADEINRASPRTQSALLQAMQEHEITVAGQTHPLPRPFHVLATQNPLEQEGTYPLPEAQLDRFLLQIDVDYPEREAERRMLLATTGTEETALPPMLNAAELSEAQQIVRRMPIGNALTDAILDLVRRARPGQEESADMARYIEWGPGPRASQALALAVRCRALMHGRPAPDMSDLAALAAPVLRHRMALTYAAQAEGIAIADIIARLLRHDGGEGRESR